MKNVLLNCDQVFDVLTRGPFPSGEPSDEGVEHHLQACHECRRLAEALRPAVALLHEAVDRDQATGLPEYQGSLPPRHDADPAPRPLSLGMRQVARRPHSGHAFDRAVSAVRVIAASLLLAALGVLTYSFAVAPAGANRAAGLGGLLGDRDEAAHLPDGPGLLTLASLKLPARCLPTGYQTLSPEQAAALAAAMAMGTEEALRCCTECHAAERSHTASPLLVAAVARSCTACHRG